MSRLQFIFASKILVGNHIQHRARAYIGRQTLCLNVDDFERVLKEHGEHTKSVYSARIAELEQNVTDLKAVNFLQGADLAKITEEKVKLLAENAEVRRKQQTVSGREGKAEKREKDRIAFWRVAAPLVNRLIAEAKPGTPYDRSYIRKAFLQDLENFQELKPAIQDLLHTAKKESENTPFALDGWGMELIRLALGDLAKKEGGATRKAKTH